MPGNLSSLGFGGQTSVTSIINGGATLPTNTCITAAQNANCLSTLSGDMTAGVLKTAYSATGKGRVNFFAVYCNDATSRTIRIKVTVNGSAVAYDKTSAAIEISGGGVIAIGSGQPSVSGVPVLFQPIDYTSGILIEFASSLTETGNKLTTAINAEVRQ